MSNCNNCEINKILVDANAVTPNGIDMILLLEHLSVEQLRDLKQKIDELYEIKHRICQVTQQTF